MSPNGTEKEGIDGRGGFIAGTGGNGGLDGIAGTGGMGGIDGTASPKGTEKDTGPGGKAGA